MFWGISVVALSLLALLDSSHAAHSLYSPTDPIVQLDVSNFEQTITGSDTAWIIEFYSAWCGHCQRFAPIFKEYAKDVEGWSKVIRVAVVACSDPKNNPVCASQNIRAFPTIKFYPANLRSLTRAYKLNSLRFNADSVRASTLRFIEQHVTPSDATPSLQRYRSINQLRKSVSRYPTHLFAVVEEDGSSSSTELAKLVVMDTSSLRPNTVVGRLPRSALPDPRSIWQPLPAIVSISQYGDNVRHISPLQSREDVVRIIKSLTETPNIRQTWQNNRSGQTQDRGVPVARSPHVSRTRATNVPLRQTEKTTTATPTWAPAADTYGLYQEDLDSNLYYSLWNEISSRTMISGSALPALKEYVRILHKYHPGNERLKSFLAILYRWVQRIGGSIDTRLYLNTLENLQTNDSYVVKDLNWKSCQGSSGQFRGYPCSLWMTFHALTVGAYEEYLKNPTGQFNPAEVMDAIRMYVKYFFSCRDCANHFLAMSKDMHREIIHPQDGVMWLWKGHNKVNNRLHGDQTEDPANPKIQFPSKNSCTHCRYDNFLPEERFDNDTNWNEVEVLRFLRKFYSPVITDQENQKNVKEKRESYNSISNGYTTGNTRQHNAYVNANAHNPHNGHNAPNNAHTGHSAYNANRHNAIQTNAPLVAFPSVANNTTSVCTPKVTPWSACSLSCGPGVSTRFTNKLDDSCEMKMEMRVCQLRRCGVDYRRFSRGRDPRVCPREASTLRERNHVTLSFNNCTTDTFYRWRYCGVCPGYCCEPAGETTFWADMTCDDGHSGKAQILWIENCRCRLC